VVDVFRKKVSSGEVVKKYNMLKKEIGVYQMHIRSIISAIDKKIERFRERLEYYKRRRELTFASIYVREISNLGMVKSILRSVDLGLLAVNLRLDTMKIVVSSLIDFKDVAKVIDSVISDARIMSENFNNYYKSFIDGYIDFETDAIIPDVNLSAFLSLHEEDAIKIIKAVERKVGEELSKKFPNVPSNLDQILSDDPKRGVRKLYEILATDGGVYEPQVTGSMYMSRSRGLNPLRSSILRININRLRRLDLRRLDKKETAILKYIINVRRGEFTYMDIYRLAKTIKTSPESILESLYNLAEMGIVVFNHGM
jgi:hypothetical protein